MSGNTKRRFGAVAITGLVIAGVVGFTSMSASGEPPPEASGPVVIQYGTLTINLTDSAGSYVVKDPAGQVIQTETIQTSQPCATVAPGSGNLLVLAPTSASDTVQIRNSAFGVNTGNTSCGSSSAAVLSGAERLTVTLGPDLINAGVSAKSAALRVTQLKKGNLRVALDGTALGSATTISQSPQTVTVAPADDFTSITLASTSTKDNEGLSLFNGTTFELVQTDPNFEVAVDCGETVTQIGGDGTIATNAQYFRGENGEKQVGACAQVGAIVEIESDDGGRVYWNNATIGINGTTQDVAGTITINWAPVAAMNASELDRQIDYDGPGAAGYTDVLWCESFSSTADVNGKVTFDAVLPPYTGVGANSNETAPWCLVSNVEVLNGNGQIVQTQVYYGNGDPWAR